MGRSQADMKTRFFHCHYGKANGAEMVPHIQQALKLARQAGQIKVHARHYSLEGVPSSELQMPQVRGATICHLEDDAGKVLATGYAFCSMQDQFCRRIGRQIAHGRARMQLLRLGRDHALRPT